MGMADIQDKSVEHLPLLETRTAASEERTSNVKPESVGNISPNEHGTPPTPYLSAHWATLFILGDQLGVGALALPWALSKAGWCGIAFIIICGMCQGFAAVILGKSWNIVISRFPEDKHARNAYPLMGQKSHGNWLGVTISVVNGLSIIGTCSVMILLSAQSLQSIFADAGGIHISYCYWVVIMAAILVPLSMLGTPKDFWPIAFIAVASIAVALFIVAVVCSWNIHLSITMGLDRTPPDVQSFALPFGPTLFAFAGIGTFPTVQQDMKDPSQFITVAVVATTILSSVYILISSLGGATFGKAVAENVIQSIPHGAMRITAETFAALHCLSVSIIHQNPLLQDLEDIRQFNIPKDFNWKRCVLRSLFLLVVAFIALSLPNFNALLALVGATLKMLLMFVAPSLIYWGLTSSNKNGDTESVYISRFVCLVVTCVGVAGGCAATYAAVAHIVSSYNLMQPCYLNVTAASSWN